MKQELFLGLGMSEHPNFSSKSNDTKNTNEQQTAVELFYEEVEGFYLHDGEEVEIVSKDFFLEVKELEKQQIIDAFVECWKANMPDGFECKLSAEEYYNDRYKTK